MLEGLKVVDISSVLAGPLTGTFMAEQGARVIKVENKTTGGDVTRQWKLAAEDAEDPYSAYYFSANYGKEVHFLDVTLSSDRDWLFREFQDADVVISNFQKKTAEKLGLTPENITRVFPKIIFAQLNAFEWDDPRPGYDLIMQAETGWISMTGTDNQHLAKLPVALMDILASHQMREGILLALLRRSTTGQGSIVHVSLFQSAVSALANQATNYLMNGQIPGPLGILHPNIMPYGDIFTAKDGTKFLLAVGSDQQFLKLSAILGVASGDVEAYRSNSERVSHRKEVSILLQQFTGLFEFQALERRFLDANIPFCRINDLSQVFTHPLANRMILSREVSGRRAKSVSTVAFQIV